LRVGNVPLTGKIISINVKVGDVVKEDDSLCILESMKMENSIVTPVSGKVVEIGVLGNQGEDQSSAMCSRNVSFSNVFPSGAKGGTKS
jgi:acetyl/propionyl-CoA carboxylase alpha subunit